MIPSVRPYTKLIILILLANIESACFAETIFHLPQAMTLNASGKYLSYDQDHYPVQRQKDLYRLSCYIDARAFPETPSQRNDLSILFDTPNVHVVRLRRFGGQIQMMVDALSIYGDIYYRLDYDHAPNREMFSLRVEAHTKDQWWKIYIDDQLVHHGGFYPGSGDVQKVRFSAGNWGGPDESPITVVYSQTLMEGFNPPSGESSITPENTLVTINQPTQLRLNSPILGDDLSYQWFFNSQAIPGAVAPTLDISHMSFADAGIYELIVSNPAGSKSFRTTLDAQEVTRPRNLSTRAPTSDKAGELVVGFVTRHEGQRDFILRAVGPALANYGITDHVSNPRIRLLQGTTEIARNHDWSENGSGVDANTFAHVGAFPLSTGSGDAALLASLSAGAYTILVENEDPSSGETLAEIYEYLNDGGLDGNLVNISTRATLRTPDDEMILGFVVGGETPRRFLIRAVGPGLGEYGVTDHVQNAQLNLVSPDHDISVFNSDWQDTPEMAAAVEESGAFPLTPGSKDAAIIVTLEPGAYTVVSRGANVNDFGTILGEVYLLD
jgi:hypothetical protein